MSFGKFTDGLNDLAKYINNWAVANGFYEPGKVRDFDGQMALVHSEVSEALEQWRKGRNPDEDYVIDGKPEGIPSEFADIIIRVLDICAHYEIDIEQAIIKKMEYNLGRPYRNGNKRS